MNRTTIRHATYWVLGKSAATRPLSVGVTLTAVLFGFTTLGWPQQQTSPPATPAQPAAAAKPVPVPAAAAIVTAEKAFEQAFAENLKQATTAKQLVDLARLFEKTAAEVTNDAERYVLLRRAHQTAVRAGVVDLSLKLTRELAARFQIDGLSEAIQTITILSKQNRTDSAASAELATAALSAVEASLAADRFTLAETALAAARTTAVRARDDSLGPRINLLTTELKLLTAAYNKVRAAETKLAAAPNDGAARLVIGHYRCLVKGEWQKGLPHLAAGSDELLKSTAKQDLTNPQEAAAQLALADDWWKIAEREEGRGRVQIQHHAASWYAKAMPKLTGLTKARAESRIAQAALAGVDSKSTAPPTYLTDLKPESILVLGRKHSQKAATVAEGPTQIRQGFSFGGKKCEHGYWAHPASDRGSSSIVHRLGKAYRELSGTAGLGDGLAKEPYSPIQFQIVGDGKVLWQSVVITKRGQSQGFKVDVTGVDKLELIVRCAGQNDHAGAVWVDPSLRK